MAVRSGNQPRVLLMGCGAVGGVLAGGLLRAGKDVTPVTHNAKITAALAADGLRLTAPEGRWTLPVTAHTQLADVPGLFDVALLAMKATAVEDAAREVLPRLSATGFVVTLQNGIVEDRVAGIVGRDRLIGALVGWGATMHAPGVYEMTSRGETVVGELDGATTLRINVLQTLLAAATPASVTDNIYGVLWSKLAINCAITAMGAVTGQRLGEMLQRRVARRLALSIVSEVMDVAQAHAVAPEPVGGTLDLAKLYVPPERRGAGLHLELLVKHAIMLAVGLKFWRLKSSMLQSLERGRKPEIDEMNGYVVARGREKGVETPVNASLVAMVREVAAGTRALSPANLDLL